MHDSVPGGAQSCRFPLPAVLGMAVLTIVSRPRLSWSRSIQSYAFSCNFESFFNMKLFWAFTVRVFFDAFFVRFIMITTTPHTYLYISRFFIISCSEFVIAVVYMPDYLGIRDKVSLRTDVLLSAPSLTSSPGPISPRRTWCPAPCSPNCSSPAVWSQSQKARKVATTSTKCSQIVHIPLSGTKTVDSRLYRSPGKKYRGVSANSSACIKDIFIFLSIKAKMFLFKNPDTRTCLWHSWIFWFLYVRFL